MCGIAGFAGEGTRENLEKMTRAISYRGPDGEGYLFDGRHKVGLGHRRLSIIDVSGGAQPIYNEDRSVAVIFNGEIYNFHELRRTLAPRHIFTTKSDTEVIVHLYEEKKENLFTELSGMFAVAIYDAKRHRMLLARDRLGKKPLYWGVFGETLLFGSELKALMQHPLCKTELDWDSLNCYFTLDYIPTPRSIWKGIYKLPPASYLVREKRQIRIETFWRPRFEETRLSFSEALSLLDQRIEKGVQERLISDVPIGIFLSGGLDSATIAYYAQKNSSAPLHTFSIAFTESSFDESEYARCAARALGTHHHEAVFAAKDMLTILPAVANLLDEPLADPSLLPTYLLSSFTKRYATVALGGDGGDELFAGYPTFQAEHIAAFFRVFPKKMYTIANFFADRLPMQPDQDFGLQFTVKRFLDGFDVEPHHRHTRWLGSFGATERRSLFTKDAQAHLQSSDPYAELNGYWKEAEAASPENALLYLYLRTYLMDQVLVKVDRASMWNALEVRAPFLDHAVVDFVQSLPYDFKCKGWRTKHILKELMHNKIPSSIVRRRKKGFGIPVAQWLRGDLRNLSHDVLSESSIKKDGLFESRYVKHLLREHEEGKRDNRKLLWPLLVFQMWYRTWGKFA